MKKIFLTFLLFLAFNVIASSNYFYQGREINLILRTDKIAIILNSSSYSDTLVKNELKSVIKNEGEIKKAKADVYLISFVESKSQSEIENYIRAFTESISILKNATRVYYGDSKKVTQIPTDEFIVRLKNLTDKDEFDIMNVVNNCSIIGNIGDEKGFILKTNYAVNKNSLQLSDIYFSSGIFEYAEPDFLYPDGCLLLSIPNDINFPAQWSLNNTGQLLQTGSWFFTEGDQSTVNGIPGSDMNVANAWDYTTGTQSVKIGIIDTGIDSLHPDFQAVDHLLCGYDAVNNINSSSTDILNHGTSAAGLIGAVMNNSIGIAGIAPSCQLMSIKIFDESGYTSNSIIAGAFDTARVRGLDILNNSWGGGTPSSTITDAIDNAANNGRNGLGCAIFFASGNDGNNPPVYPSTLQNVLSVGASTPHDQAKSPGTGNMFFWGSNYGEDMYGDLDLLAPTNCYTLKTGGYEPNFWGTSCSCPNAAGVAALVLSVNISQTRIQIYDNLLRGCDKIDNVPYSSDRTYGKWNDYYGYGRVNALNSVRLAAGVDATPPSINHLNLSSHSSTYPTLIKAEIVDQNGSPVPTSEVNQPKLFYRLKKNNGAWSEYDSLIFDSFSGNDFIFKIPSTGWETEVQYYLRARDINGNETTFPKHAPDSFWLCYFAVGNITFATNKIGSFAGTDYGSTLSPSVYFGNFNVISTSVKIYLRHTFLDDEVIQLFSPVADANNNRKCLFSSNGGDMDNITGASATDSSDLFWKDGLPPYWLGHYKPDINMRGYNGTSANGNWRILHFDRAFSDHANFDSIRITLGKTSGTTSSSARLNNPIDSILNFGIVNFPNTYLKDFYLKNSGTANLSVSNVSFSGTFATAFSLISLIPVSIPPEDSGLFTVSLNTNWTDNNANHNSAESIENAMMNITTNDPSKNIFKVSLQTDNPLNGGLKILTLNVLIEGLFEPITNTSIGDSVTVHLRKVISPYEIVDSSKSFIDSFGEGTFNFYNLYNDSSYYIVVNHRNSIETWSATGNSFIASVLLYNFTNDSLQAYGSNMVLRGNRYCLFTGDVNKDGIIDGSDFSLVEDDAVNFTMGYIITDLNGDLIVDGSDFVIVDNNSHNLVQVSRPE